MCDDWTSGLAKIPASGGLETFTGSLGLEPLPFQIGHAKAEHQRSAKQAQQGCCEQIGAEFKRRNHIMDRGRARQSGERESPRAEGNGAAKQAFGNVGFAEQPQTQRVHREDHHEDDHSAIGEQSAGEHRDP